MTDPVCTGFVSHDAPARRITYELSRRTPMTTRQWEHVKELFHEAAGVDPARREALLRRRSGGDELVVREVLALLEAHTESLAPPTAPDADEHAVADKAAARLHGLGRSVGPYRLVRVLGEGGMGVVYLAERAEPMRQVVALKVVRAELESRQALARFDAERQSLALMDHPNVAKVFDAGVDDDGRPFFVMEYVPGEPITSYCDSQRLDMRRRLELFTQACDAVSHAHQKAVIHRDLKPGNILVATVDGKPVVKVIDFGVAKTAGGDLAAHSMTRYTVQGQWVGTPDYMSPEQAAGDSGDVDTRTDVYSLGVILYEMLAGHPPHRISRRPLPEALWIVRNEEPATLSSVSRRFRGDVDWVVRRAMEKDKARRYAGASDFAVDLRRHLAGEPTAAHPPSRWYQVGKLARRNRGLVTGAAAVAVVLVLGVAMSTWQAVSATRGRAAAVAEKQRAERLFDDSRRLVNTLASELHELIRDLPGSTPARMLLVRRSLDFLDRLSRESKDNPSLEREVAATLDLVGHVQGNPHHSNLGDTAGAHASYARSMEIRKRLLATHPDPQAARDLATSHVNIGAILRARGRTHEALASYEEALRLIREVAGLRDGDSAFPQELSNIHVRMGELYSDLGRRDDAMNSFEAALAIRQVRADAEPDNLRAQVECWGTHLLIGDENALARRWTEALARYDVGMRGNRAVAERNPNSFIARHELAAALHRMSEAHRQLRAPRRALDHSTEAISLLTAMQAADPSNMRACRNLAAAQEQLATVYDDLGDRTAGLAAHERSVEHRKMLVKAHPSDVQALGHLSRALRRLGQHHENWAAMDDRVDKRTADLESARSCYMAGIEAINGFEGADGGDDFDLPVRRLLEADVARCNHALAALTRSPPAGRSP